MINVALNILVVLCAALGATFGYMSGGAKGITKHNRKGDY